jgi:enoyl-CoA hydratase
MGPPLAGLTLKIYSIDGPAEAPSSAQRMVGMEQSRYQTLVFHRSGRVLTIEMNRPKELNSVNHGLHEELSRVFIDAADDPASDVIVLTGAGKAFSSGGDVEWLSEQLQGDGTPFVLESRVVRRIVHSLLDCPKPTISKINGDAFGLGATLALLCDISIAADTARFADPHVRIGLVAGDGGALIWPQLIGFAKAKHYLLTGEAVNARDAERMNLISFVVPSADLDAFVERYAGKLASGAQSAIRYTKMTVNIALRQLLTSVFEAGVAYEGLTKHSAEFREGVAAFVEKRKPSFPGIDPD